VATAADAFAAAGAGDTISNIAAQAVRIFFLMKT
jgi:glycerol dehydrogenase-like iron-containing ADH family enzyme